MLRLNGKPIEINHFPDKTLMLKDLPAAGNTLEWHFESNEELVALYFIANHLKSNGQGPLHLVMKYIPNARQDRTNSEKDVFTLKYFAQLINSLNFQTVSVLDAHSNVALSLIDRVVQLPVKPYLEQAIAQSGIDPERDMIFYPDEGSQKRYGGLIPFPHAFGHKKRNWDDGQITGLEVIGQLPEKPFNVLIVDDICSFGGTFWHSAQKLKALGADKIFLYVTHCENNLLQGKLMESGLIERIYTTSSLFTDNHPLITVME